MKSLKELLKVRENNKAFPVVQKLEDGNLIPLPGYMVDYIEQNAREVKEFKFDLLTQGQAGMMARNTIRKRKVDVHHNVSHTAQKRKQSVIDET